MIKVGFDISQIAHKGGVSTYTKNLTNELSKISELDIAYFYSSLRKAYSGDLKNVKAYRLPPTLFELLFNKFRNIPIERFLGSMEVFHSSDWVQPPTKAKKVTTYHDVVPIKYPQWSHPKIIAVHKRRLNIVEKEIDKVIAVSEATKRDLLEITKIPEEKISVIYEAPTGNFTKQSTEKIQRFKKKYNLPEKFVLAIGGIGERRNLHRVKEAAKDYNLVISGETIPWLVAEELELLYSSADILIYPSLYEGFGIPILDAFICELPVITSNVSSMPEVGGDAAIYVDPKSVEAIHKRIKEISFDKDLREVMIRNGLKQASKFSWEKTAIATYQLYKSLI